MNTVMTFMILYKLSTCSIIIIKKIYFFYYHKNKLDRAKFTRVYRQRAVDINRQKMKRCFSLLDTD